MAQISIEGITIEFPVFSPRARSLRAAITGQLKGTLGGVMTRRENVVTVRALDDVTLQVRDGDRIALIGGNGAGKTTLLRTIVGVYPPVAGRISVQGRVAAFTDMMLGMDMEATGWDNIIYRCVFLGLTFGQARELAPAIAEFTELGDYLDVPVRTYSQGMMLRLAFAVATSIHPDILVMDEMIGAGDASFAGRAVTRVNELLERSKILVMASQSPAILKSYCTRAVWLEHGRVRMEGTVDEVLAQYQAEARSAPAYAP
jgi:ABC-type polysaccharide/polyol phosphate transport system ATPase subunit